MSRDDHAMTKGTTLDDEHIKEHEQRTTLLGKPIVQQHDHYTNMMLGDGGGFGAGNAGANLLPPGYTDKSLTRVPIKMSDLEDTTSTGSDIQTEKKGGLFSKLSGKRKEGNDEIKVVMMSRGDHLRYWVKGPDGKFADSTEEPPEGRKEWVRQQLELNEEWKKNDPSLTQTKHTHPQGFMNKVTGHGAGLSLG